MALPKVEEARQLDDQALDEAIVATKRRLFELRFQKATRQLESGFHQFKHERHRLAQLMTVRRERLATEEVSAAPTDSEAAPTPVTTATSAIEEE
ncbi:MAG: 50S ribosomal protein L29 [Leptolyngbyaceae cyanobacterium]